MQVGGCVEYTKRAIIISEFTPLDHTLLTFFIRIGTFNCFHVF